MKTYNISYKNDSKDSFLEGCHIEADNPITALLAFFKKFPGATLYGMKLIENN